MNINEVGLKRSDREEVRYALRKILKGGYKKFILYPYGKLGKITKDLLNNEFGINEIAILDNQGDDEGVKKLSWLQEKEMESDEYILITSNNLKIYNEIRANIRAYVDENNILDMFQRKMYLERNEYLEYVATKRKMNLESCIVKLPNCNASFYLPWWKKEELQKAILTTGNYYEEEELFFIKKNLEKKIGTGIVLDIGANIGNHAIFFALECGVKKILAFEPMKDTFSILQKNIKINSLEKIITAYNFGVGEKRGNADVAARPENNRAGTILKSAKEGTIEICSIDELQINDKVSFMKIDVEGFESKVIKGALDTIKRNKPSIVVEIWKHNETFFEIIDMLRPLGYDYIMLDEQNYLFSTGDII